MLEFVDSDLTSQYKQKEDMNWHEHLGIIKLLWLIVPSKYTLHTPHVKANIFNAFAPV